MAVEAEALIVGLLGLVVGSFLNVIIYRLPRQKSIVSPSSRCGICRSSIVPYMNVPILSYIFSLGRCSKCGAIYSGRYPVVELLTALLFLGVWSHYGFGSLTLIYCFFVAALVVASFIDLELRLIPDSVSVGGWALALIVSMLSIPHYPMTLYSALVGSAVGFGLFFILSRSFFWITGEEGLGGGDVKLMGFVGAVLGLKGVIVTTLIGSVLGAFVGLVVLIVMRKGRRFPIPFGPFLAVGALFSLYGFGDLIFQIPLAWGS